jgi:hypothetical protein
MRSELKGGPTNYSGNFGHVMPGVSSMSEIGDRAAGSGSPFSFLSHTAATYFSRTTEPLTAPRRTGSLCSLQTNPRCRFIDSGHLIHSPKGGAGAEPSVQALPTFRTETGELARLSYEEIWCKAANSVLCHIGHSSRAAGRLRSGNTLRTEIVFSDVHLYLVCERWYMRGPA